MAVPCKDKWEQVLTYPDQDYTSPAGRSYKLTALFRLKVPGGWLISQCSSITGDPAAITFYPDSTHTWLPSYDEDEGW